MSIEECRRAATAAGIQSVDEAISFAAGFFLGQQKEHSSSSKSASAPDAPSREAEVRVRAILRSAMESETDNALTESLSRKSSSTKSMVPRLGNFNTISLEPRARAAQALGKPGSLVNDLREVHISELKDKSSLAYWRFFEDSLRLWRSESVTRALRLICSATVPSLEPLTYLDVFRKIEHFSASWRSHTYLFGGIVRDALLCKVGNDVDIAFSAPAAKLQELCRREKWTSYLDGDYIMIGDKRKEEYLEGMVISFNGIQRGEYADFTMNTLFFDLSQNLIIDKTGKGVDAVRHNRVQLPCSPEVWAKWATLDWEPSKCFRFFKFLLRGYVCEEKERVFVTKHLIDFWSKSPATAVEVGKDVFGGKKIDKKKLEKIVVSSFNLATAPQRRDPALPKLGHFHTTKVRTKVPAKSQAASLFMSGRMWWLKGWSQCLGD